MLKTLVHKSLDHYENTYPRRMQAENLENLENLYE
jgi:hypothetical protein